MCVFRVGGKMEENGLFFRLEQILSSYTFMLVMETKQQNRLVLI